MAITLISVLFVQEGVFCTNRIIVLIKSLYIERLYWGFGNLKKIYIVVVTPFGECFSF